MTVLVKQVQAEVLALADSSARIRLALRNPADREQQDTRRLTVSQFFDGAMPPSKSAGQTAKVGVAPARASEGLRAGTTVAKVN